MNELQRLRQGAAINYSNNNPEPSSTDAAASNEWSRGLIAAMDRARDDYHTRIKAAEAARRATGGSQNPTSEEQAAGRAASTAVYELASANRANQEALRVAQVAASLAIYGDPSSKEYQDTLRAARADPVSRAIYEARIKRAVEATPAVVAARTAYDIALSNTLPIKERAAYLKTAADTFSAANREAQHAHDLAVAQLSNTERNNLTNIVITQSSSARGPRGTTPVAPPKPPKKAPKKPLKKPKGRR